jgi:chemotaxis protein histidine kinase CheA
MSRYILITTGPTGSGKSKLPEAVDNYLGLENVLSKATPFLVDDLVVNNPRYINGVKNYLNKYLDNPADLKKSFLTGDSEIIKYFNFLYFDARKETDCKTGKTIHNTRSTVTYADEDKHLVKSKTEAFSNSLAKAENEVLAKAKVLAKVLTKAKANIKSKTEALVLAKDEDEVATKAKSEAKANFKAKYEALVLAKDEVETKAKVNVKNKTEALVLAKAEAKVKTEAEALAKANVKNKTEALVLAKADVKNKTEALVLAKAEAKTKTEAKVKTKTKTKAKTKAKVLAKNFKDHSLQINTNNLILNCDDLNDILLKKAILQKKNILLETQGMYDMSWLFDLNQNLSDYNIIFALSVVDICKLIYRNKMRAYNVLNLYLESEPSSVKPDVELPRIPVIDRQEYVDKLMGIIKTFNTMIVEFKSPESNKTGLYNVRLLIFDNNEITMKILYDNSKSKRETKRITSSKLSAAVEDTIPMDIERLKKLFDIEKHCNEEDKLIQDLIKKIEINK